MHLSHETMKNGSSIAVLGDTREVVVDVACDALGLPMRRCSTTDMIGYRIRESEMGTRVHSRKLMCHGQWGPTR